MVYMLHCAQSMYNHLLWANWNKTSLAHVILIGNKLSSYHERLVYIHIRKLILVTINRQTSQQLKETSYYIYQVSLLVE